jgi:hypothetical protein
MLPVFISFLSVCVLYLFFQFITEINFKIFKSKYLSNFEKVITFLKNTVKSFMYLIDVFASFPFIIFFSITMSIFVFFSFMPYIQNLSDQSYIIEQEKNIKLYNEYTEIYSESARKQIEEYQRMQSEMSARANVQQLQFWSLQQDDIGNALTERIEEYQTNIKEARLEINKRKARIETRRSNKWYFFLED